MPTDRTSRGRAEAGFTLIEMLSVLALAAILMTLSAGALRTYWFTQALAGSRDEVVNELRRAQERAVSESNPRVHGVLLREGSSSWSAVEYDPTRPAGSECLVITENTLESRSEIETATFSEVPTITAACVAQITPASTADDYAFFFPRGSATNGTVTLTHPQKPGTTWTITVTPITGRVEVQD